MIDLLRALARQNSLGVSAGLVLGEGDYSALRQWLWACVVYASQLPPAPSPASLLLLMLQLLLLLLLFPSLLLLLLSLLLLFPSLLLLLLSLLPYFVWSSCYLDSLQNG